MEETAADSLFDSIGVHGSCILVMVSLPAQGILDIDLELDIAAPF